MTRDDDSPPAVAADAVPKAEPPALAAASLTLDQLRAARPQFSWKVWLVWFGATSLIFGFVFADGFAGEQFEPGILVLLAGMQGLMAATIYYGGYVSVRRWMHRSMLKRLSAHAIEKKAESLQEELGSDFFTNLVKINFKYIDRYYLQTQIQADKSFLLSAIACMVGLAIIAAGIVMMYLKQTQPAYVTTATGVLCEGIAGLFFYLYNQTILKMADYHRKLVLTQNIGLALRITQDLPEKERVMAQVSLVDRLSLDVNRHLVDASN